MFVRQSHIRENFMKKISGNSDFAHVEGERIAGLISARLKESQSGDCISLEEMAALIDGNVKDTERDRMMSHLASCDRCYETFLLTSELSEEKIIPLKRTFFSHPMRLAASIVIAAFSLFLFYKIVFMPGFRDKLVPTTSEPGKVSPAPVMKEGYKLEKREEIPEKIEPEEEGTVPETTAVMDKAAAAEKAAQPPAKKGRVDRSSMKRGKGEIGGIEAKKSYKKDGVPVDDISVIPVDKKKPGKAGEKEKSTGKKGGRGQLQKGDVRQEVAQQHLQNVEKDEKFGRDITQQDRQNLQEQKLQTQKSREPKQQQAAQQQFQYVQQEQDIKQKKTAAPEKAGLQAGKRVAKEPGIPAARRRVTATGGVTDTWGAVERLNIKISRQYTKYIPAAEIRNLFETAVLFAARLEQESRQIQAKDAARDYLSESDARVKKLEPLIISAVVKDTSLLTANVPYFLQKSEPGTREFRFFTLARSGWCDGRRCYGSIKEKVKKEARKKLLQEWRELKPELSGIFLEIADATIIHLSK